MRIYVAPDLKHRPKPQLMMEDAVSFSWDLYPRTVVCPTRNFKNGLYESAIKEKTFFLRDVGYVTVRHNGEWTLELMPNCFVNFGLGIMFDFGQDKWFVGIISMRLVHLFKGLSVLSSGNPIRAGLEGETVCVVKNNSQVPLIIRSDEPLVQIHFQSVLVSPKVEMLPII